MSERSSKDEDNRTRRQLSLQFVSRLLLNKTVEEWGTGHLLLAACRASQTDPTNEALDEYSDHIQGSLTSVSMQLSNSTAP